MARAGYWGTDGGVQVSVLASPSSPHHYERISMYDPKLINDENSAKRRESRVIEAMLDKERLTREEWNAMPFAEKQRLGIALHQLNIADSTDAPTEEPPAEASKPKSHKRNPVNKPRPDLKPFRKFILGHMLANPGLAFNSSELVKLGMDRGLETPSGSNMSNVVSQMYRDTPEIVRVGPRSRPTYKWVQEPESPVEPTVEDVIVDQPTASDQPVMTIMANVDIRTDGVLISHETFRVLLDGLIHSQKGTT